MASLSRFSSCRRRLLPSTSAIEWAGARCLELISKRDQPHYDDVETWGHAQLSWASFIFELNDIAKSCSVGPTDCGLGWTGLV